MCAQHKQTDKDHATPFVAIGYIYVMQFVDSADCLPILLNISVFHFLVFLFSTFYFLVPCGSLS